MGMSASQARLLFVSSRINDVELKSQQISNTKMRLAAESEQVANDYTKALNQTRLMITNPVDQTKSQLTYGAIMTPSGQMSGAYNIQTAGGKVVVTSQIADAFEGAANLTEFLSNMKIQKSDTTIAAEELSQAQAELNEANSNLSGYTSTLKSKNITVSSNGKLNFPTKTYTEKVTTVDKSDSAKGGGSTSVADGVADGKNAGNPKTTSEVRTVESSSSAGSSKSVATTTSTKVETTERTSSAGKAQTVTTTTTGVHTVDIAHYAGGKSGAVSGSQKYEVTTKVVITEHVYTAAEEKKFQADYDALKAEVTKAQQNYNAANDNYKNTGSGQLNESSTGNEYYYTNLYNTMKDNGYEAYSTKALNNPEYLQVQLEQGNWYIGKKDENGKYVSTSLSSNTQVVEENDNTGVAKAEAEYNAKTAKINRKEKMLDMQLKNLDTEHSALSTEYDSLKTLIGDNIEKSFNLFS